jgi:hypothetical protein
VARTTVPATLFKASGPPPGFRPCRTCGCPVLVPALGVALTPVLGAVHLCGENCTCRWADDRPKGAHAPEAAVLDGRKSSESITSQRSMP